MNSGDLMRQYVKAFPEMLEQAWRAPVPERFPVREERAILFAGMGGSAMAGAVAEILLRAAGRLAITWRSAFLPEWAGPRDACVVLSYSGETWEALSLLSDCRGRSVPVRAVASGGTLSRRCREEAVACFPAPAGYPPRACLPWLLAGALRAAGGIGDPEVEAAAEQVRRQAASSSEGRDPVRLGALFEGRIVLLLPVGPVRETVALRWRNQILENAEQTAFVCPIPEMAHNELMGWPWMREASVPVGIALLEEVPERMGVWEPVARALEAEAARQGHPFLRIPATPGEGLGPLLADIHLADRVSVELAERRGVAPTPVEAIARLRALVGGRGKPHEPA